MFPGSDPLVVYFEDTKKRMGARCLHHPAFIQELEEVAGPENVVIK
jgi:DNA polymerase-3 subunit alpha